MLMGAFGRYSGGGVLYERSIYLELANAGRVFKRDLKTERTKIVSPRLNMCVLGHPFSFVEAYHSERSNKDDGLTHRFFASCPPPVIYMSHEIMASEAPTCNLLLILYLIRLRYKIGKRFSLSEEANILFNSQYDTFRHLVQKTRSESTFIAAMCGKGNKFLSI